MAQKEKRPSGVGKGIKKSEIKRKGAGWLFIWNVTDASVLGLTGMSDLAMAFELIWVRSLEAILQTAERTALSPRQGY